MTKKLMFTVLLLLLPSVSFAQTNKKISELTELSVTPANDDVLPITDVSAITTKKIRVDTLLGALGGGGDLGANLSSTGDNIFSTTGSVTFDNMVIYADSFVATGGTMSIMDDFEVLNQLIIPTYQDCSTLLENGEVCIDGNISGMTDAMSFKGSDGQERVNINMLKSAIVSINDNDSLYFDDATNSWVTLPANIPFWDGVDGSQVYPLTPATTDLYIGGNTSGSADHWIKSTGEMIVNQQNNDVTFNVQGDTTEYLIYTVDNVVSIGTNTPAVDALLTVQGTLAVSGTLIGAITFDNLASSDPCTAAGSDQLKNNTIFMTTGGLVCKCNNSGVDIDIEDGTSCF